jgi:hypothetical protein
LNERGGDVAALSLPGTLLIRSVPPKRAALSRSFTQSLVAITLCHACASGSSPARQRRHITRRANRLMGSKSKIWRSIMKTILSALLAVSVLTGVAVAPASAAWDTKAFWENLDRQAGGGN